MFINVLSGILIPFIGTALGAALVFFKKKQLGTAASSLLAAFSGGVMVAASVFSLLLPAMETAERLGALRVLPAGGGLLAGILFMSLTDFLAERMETGASEADRRGKMTVFAITLHNLPEGIAVGIAYSAVLCSGGVNALSAAALAIGVAIQNVPEGAIVSLPVADGGATRPRAFLSGVLSGAVEPIAAFLTLACADALIPAFPFLLGFAAGAMLFVVAAELSVDMAAGKPRAVGCFFTAGFLLMMALDVLLS